MEYVQFVVQVPCTEERFVHQKKATLNRVVLAGFGEQATVRRMQFTQVQQGFDEERTDGEEDA